jgi:hypothetical protein
MLACIRFHPLHKKDYILRCARSFEFWNSAPRVTPPSEPWRFGGAGLNFLRGDAETMSGNTRGGDDRFCGGVGDDTLWGDATRMQDNAQGGDDTFVFNDAFGTDTVRDFRRRG